jgi:hypothetical protein
MPMAHTIDRGCGTVCQADSVTMIGLRIVVGLLGGGLVVVVIGSAIKTVVLPRGSSSWIARLVFLALRRGVIDPLASPKRSFDFRDRVLALYAPVGLLLLPVAWLLLIVLGFSAIFWATGVRPLTEAFVTSGSSLTTLGFVRPPHVPQVALGFAEAGIGLGLLSLMISYLPSIYGAFSRREMLVGLLEVRAGLSPSPVELLVRYQRIGWLAAIDAELFPAWELWFADIEESHTSQPALVFFRSPHPARSWITAAGCVLDVAAIVNSSLDRPHDPRADITLRAGFICLRRISDFYGIQYRPNPQPTDPISIQRDEFDAVLAQLAANGLPIKADREQAWRDFAGWRVNYDDTLLALCALVVAPPADWSSDRSPTRRQRIKLRRTTLMKH